MRRMNDDELKQSVSKLSQKRETLVAQLISLETKRRDMQKQLERRMRLRTKQKAEERKALKQLKRPGAELNDAIPI